MKAYMIQLQCMTNMHVGNGDVNYNIIDNEVERDPVTGYPTINSVSYTHLTLPTTPYV